MNFLKKLGAGFLGNYKQIIVAFVISIVAWFAVSIQVFPSIENSISGIAIEIQPTDYMLQNNLQIVSSVSDGVNIRIEGKRYDITGLSAEDFYASLDLSAVKSAGSFTVPVSVSNKVGTDYTLLESSPRAITLQIDEIVTREFPVTPTAPNISLPEGYYADELTAAPDRISITGSASVLNNITSVEARSVFGGEIAQSHETQSEIIVYGANGALLVNDSLEFSTGSISVNIPIYKQKELPLTFSLTNYPSNFDLTSLKSDIQPATITVAAPDDSIDFLSELNIGEIDLTDIRLNQTVSIPISLPDGYKNLSGNNSARIIFDISDYSKVDFNVSNISISNAPDNYDVTLITNELQITVIGPSEQLSALTAEDLYVTANLLGVSLRDGSQDVAVTVRARGTRQQCWASGSYKVTVNAQPVEQ